MYQIRSYMRRQGHMFPAQKRALAELWQDYGITVEGELTPDALFGRHAPLHLEIGFGMGDALLEMAGSHPENDYLGIEVHLPGVGRLLQRLQQREITNVRIDRRDAIEVLKYLPTQSLAGVYLFFPDPWSKKRHQKRRLVQAAFIEQLRQVLKPGGLFHATTDWDDYARHMLSVIESTDGFVNRAGPGNFHPRPEARPLTQFERRGLQQGHEVRDLIYQRI
ncbi:MAG: tRNA (guanosine(46)-N7)-methyltransferase TrmB [Proteobacteria bacterium]|nr:tRNA (guanosine(46)-N7)-methyltransferase TrmB [Pseudomonadota bacterium]MBU1709973.1 tRNA (guanosine(46)-N7)-methyltransferase TrmB [Pseudomonadota bacterium]